MNATDLILSIFRLNGLLLEAGDKMAVPSGLSAARWQVLGALIISRRPLTIGEIAHEMGLTRQAIQRVARAMVEQGQLKIKGNPRHKRAYFLVPSDNGRLAYDQVMRLQKPWAEALLKGHGSDDLRIASRTLRQMIRHLEAEKT